jgi:hypothetical protein
MLGNLLGKPEVMSCDGQYVGDYCRWGGLESWGIALHDVPQFGCQLFWNYSS